jgi:hypothetical protein
MLKPVRAAAAHSTAFIPTANAECSPHVHLAEDERAAAAVVAAHLALGVELSQPVRARHDAPQRDLRALHVVCRCWLTLRCMLRGSYSIPSQESDTLGATWWCHDCAVNTWLSGLARRGEGRAGQGRGWEEGGGGGRGAGRGGTAWPSLWVGTAESAFSGLGTSSWLRRASSSGDMTPMGGGAASAPPPIGGVPGVHDRCPLWHKPCSAQRAMCAAMFHARQDGAARRRVSGGETGLS